MSFLAYYGFLRAVRPEVIHNILGRTLIQPEISTEGIISILYQAYPNENRFNVIYWTKLLWLVSSSSVISAGSLYCSCAKTCMTSQWQVAASRTLWQQCTAIDTSNEIFARSRQTTLFKFT